VTNVDNQQLWTAVVDYYYDNIHWAVDSDQNPPSIREWLKRDYQVDYSMHRQQFLFPNEEIKSWFLLRWQ